MAGIYDIAARLDTEGVEAPARLNAARISLAEQSAREAPLQFQRQQKIWGREDEQYAQGQEAYKQQQEVARHGKLSQEISKLALISQTPDGFVRNVQKLLGDDARLPIYSSALSEVAQMDIKTFQKEKPMLSGSFGNIAEAIKATTGAWQESTKQAEEYKLAEMEQKAMGTRETGLETQRQTNRIALEGVKTTNRKIEIALHNEGQRRGISEAKLADLVPAAQQAFTNEFMEPVLKPDGTPETNLNGDPVYRWKSERPKTDTEINKWNMDWLQKQARGINRIVEEESVQGGAAGNNLIEVDY